MQLESSSLYIKSDSEGSSRALKTNRKTECLLIKEEIKTREVYLNLNKELGSEDTPTYMRFSL